MTMHMRSSNTSRIGLPLAALTALIVAGVAGCATEEERVQADPVPEIYATTPTAGDELSSTVNASVEEVVMAGVLALNNLNMVGTEGAVTGATGDVTATTPSGEQILIQVDRLGDEEAEFTVSIAGFGNNELLQLIESRTLAFLQEGDVSETPAQVPSMIDEAEREEVE